MYDNGLVIINLEREKTLLFSKDYYCEIELQHALDWMQTNQCYGLIVQGKNGKADCKVFAITDEHEEELDLKTVSEQLLEIVQSWE